MRKRIFTMLIVMILPAEGWISSPYGWRVDPFTKHWGFHRGVDVANHYAMAVKATEGGTVLFAGKKAGYGRLVILGHEGGVQTYYGHLGRTFVNKGGNVAQGQLVGWMGMTGRATGAHVHYEARKNGKAVGPTRVPTLQRSNGQISDFRAQISNFRYQSSDFKSQISDIRSRLEQFWAMLIRNLERSPVFRSAQ